MVAPTKIIAGLGLSLGIDILQAPGATGDYRTLLTLKAKAIATSLSAPLEPPRLLFLCLERRIAKMVVEKGTTLDSCT